IIAYAIRPSLLTIIRASLRLLAFPDLSSHASPDRAAHAGAAKSAITVRVFRQVLLVIILGEIERRRIADLVGDRPHPLGCKRLGIGGLRSLRRGALLRREDVDAGAV